MLFRMSSFQRPYVFHFAINFTLGKLNDVMDLFSTLTAHYHLHFITKLQIKYCLCWETIPTQPCYMTYSVFFLYSFDFFLIRNKKNQIYVLLPYFIFWGVASREDNCVNFEPFVFPNHKIQWEVRGWTYQDDWHAQSGAQCELDAPLTLVFLFGTSPMQKQP